MAPPLPLKQDLETGTEKDHGAIKGQACHDGVVALSVTALFGTMWHRIPVVTGK